MRAEEAIDEGNGAAHEVTDKVLPRLRETLGLATHKNTNQQHEPLKKQGFLWSSHGRSAADEVMPAGDRQARHHSGKTGKYPAKRDHHSFLRIDVPSEAEGFMTGQASRC